ncbi:MAG: hypothetical protein AABX07_02035 [Nanoarchaeota archaeon]
MLNITDEQRDAIDAQVRERVLHEIYLNQRQKFLPVAAMVFCRASLGLGINLENACPYMRDCDNKAHVLCVDNSYRNCPYYTLHLTTDFLDGQIDLAQAGIEQNVSLPAK